MASLKPMKLYGNIIGPNPFKVAIILEELDIRYELVKIPVSDTKKPEYTKLNPNGRLPTLYDPNTDFTLWESGAIIHYLVEKYDTENKISYPTGSNEHYLTNQWLHFQMSGQGPYVGQYSWFEHYHPEEVPSALDRYATEAVRLTMVLDKWLAGAVEGGDGMGERQWLVGDKATYADLAWIPWQAQANQAFKHKGLDVKKDAPHAVAWYNRMIKRPSVSSLNEERRAVLTSMVDPEQTLDNAPRASSWLRNQLQLLKNQSEIGLLNN